MTPMKRCLLIFLFTLISNPAYGQDLIWLEDFQGCITDTVSTTCMITNPDTPIGAFGLDVTYDTSMLDYIETLPGDLTEEFFMFAANEIFPGQVRIGGFAHDSPPDMAFFGLDCRVISAFRCPKGFFGPIPFLFGL